MKTIITAEIGINGNGDINLTKKLIRIAKEAGCDYVKFQKRTIDLLYTKEELNVYKESPWGLTFRLQKEGLEYTEKEYQEIDEYCFGLGIGWYASPWDCLSIDFLKQFKCDYLKIPSAKMTDTKYLKYIKKSKTPLIVSTGMCTDYIIKDTMKIIGDNVQWILACTSTYPSKEDELNLRYIRTLRNQYPDKFIGYSNHSPAVIFMPMAVVLGAKMIECHITVDRSIYGSDQASSIEPEGLKHLIEWIQGVERAMGTGKKIIYPGEETIMKKLRR